MAANLLTILPIAIIYAFLQNYFIRGIALSGLNNLGKSSSSWVRSIIFLSSRSSIKIRKNNVLETHLSSTSNVHLHYKEDTGCAERTPPWGAPDIETYIARLRQNISTLRKFPQVKIGYEWSGLELELLKEDAPEVFDEMLELAHKGQTTFYNGTYSQPHLQTLSSESNYRQFEWGAACLPAIGR